MIKRCYFLLCVMFVVQTKCDCSDNFLKCFSDFAESFFYNITEIQHVNASAENIPEDYKQVKDIEIKTIQEITDSIQDQLFKRLNSRVANDVVVVTDNPKTNIFVKTFSYNFGDSFLSGLDNIKLDSDEDQTEEVDHTEEVDQPQYLERNEKLKTDQFSYEDQSTITTEIADIIHEKNSTHEPKIVTEDSALISSKKQNIDKENYKQQHKTIETTTLAITTTSPQHNTQKLKEVEAKTEIPAKKTQTNNNNDDVSITTNTNNAKQEQKMSEERSSAQTANPNHNTQKNLAEKQFEKDIRENLIQTDDEKYDYNIEDTSDYPQIDYIDLYKDTTNEENEYVPTDSPKAVDMKDEIVENVEEYNLEIETDLDIDNTTAICHGNTSDVSNIFPWIATIFIKNDTSNNQFQYICDGALLSDKLLITAARCVNFFNSTVNPDDVLVFLGKRSLQAMGNDEKSVRISQIKIHGNFSNEDGKVDNDLALLVLEEPVTFSGGIRPACLGDGEGAPGKSASTAWDLTGALKPVFYEKNKNEDCDLQNGDDNTFCATYGNEVALCPSYGGIFATKLSSRWYLHAIRSGDTADRGPCFTKDVLYTSLDEHQEWIVENME